jgi:hypothetical protein
MDDVLHVLFRIFLALSPTGLDADICGESGPRKTSLTPHEFTV